MRSFTALFLSALVGVAVAQKPADVAVPTVTNPTFNQNLTTPFPFFPSPYPYPFPFHFPAYRFPAFPGYQNPLNRFSYPQFQAFQQYQNPLFDRFNYQQFQNLLPFYYPHYQNRLPNYYPQYQGAQDNDRFLPLLIPAVEVIGDLAASTAIAAAGDFAFEGIKQLIG